MRIPGRHRRGDGRSYLDQSQVGDHGLNLLDDLWLGSWIKRFELHVEDCLFFWFLLEVVGRCKLFDLGWGGTNGDSWRTSSAGSAAVGAAAGAAVAAGMAIS